MFTYKINVIDGTLFWEGPGTRTIKEDMPLC
jgi:hypothetical protein